MINKNIYLTDQDQTLIPIHHIDFYKDKYVKEVFNTYKFKNAQTNQYLLNLCIDLCINSILDNPDSNIVFTYPPSTMFYRKEKSLDSMGNLITQVEKSINFHLRTEHHKYYFKKIFSINLKYLKNKKAQHIHGDRKSRIKDLSERYYINFWNRKFFNKLANRKTIVVIIDDVSSTGGTLLACKKTLEKYNFEVELYSLAH